VILTVTSSTGLLAEIECSKAIPVISINGDYINLFISNPPSSFLFLNPNNIGAGDIITLAWTPLYSVPVAPVANQIGYTWNLALDPLQNGTAVVDPISFSSSRSSDTMTSSIVFNTFTSNGVDVSQWFTQLDEILNGTGFLGLPAQAILNVSFNKFSERAIFVINSYNTSISFYGPTISLAFTGLVFQDFFNNYQSQIADVMTVSWQPSYSSGGESIRNWIFDSSHTEAPGPGRFSVDTNNTYISVNNSDTDGSALRWINSLHGLFANTAQPVLMSLVDDSPTATITTAFIITAVDVGVTATKIYTTHVTIPFDDAMGVNFIFTIEAGGGGASGPGGTGALYTPANPGDWSNPAPTTVAEALDRLVAFAATALAGSGLPNP
jgi:hypothetical protein